MAGFLLDTSSALSSFAPGRPPLRENVRQRAVATGYDRWIPTLVIPEIEFAMPRLRRAGIDARAEALARRPAVLTRDSRRLRAAGADIVDPVDVDPTT